MKVIDVLLDFIKSTNDRNEKVLEFHHPEDMKKLLQLEIPDSPVNLQQLIVDCAQTLKYQVKTGEFDKEDTITLCILFYPGSRRRRLQRIIRSIRNQFKSCPQLCVF